MNKYAWIIDKDLIDEGKSLGVVGPYGAEWLEGKKAERFRMLDDDGTVYYKGRITGDYDGFEPLDDYGMPNAGATEIQFYEGGKWVTL